MLSISIVVAIFKPGTHLENLKSNLSKQILFDPDQEIEVIFVDGEMSDRTREFCEVNSFIYLENEDVDPVSAKYIGLIQSTSELVCFIDQDETFENPYAIENRIIEFEKNSNLVVLFPSGYVITPDMNNSNVYTTLFGDPFNQYIHKFPNCSERVLQISKRTEVVETETSYLFLEKKNRTPMLLEFGCMGSTMHKTRLLNSLNREILRPELPHLYYLLNNQRVSGSIAILKNDGIFHNSSANWGIVKEKITWRIMNNLSQDSTISGSGVRGRLPTKVYLESFRFKQMAYLFYIATLILPLVSAIQISFKYKRFGLIRSYFLHYFLLTQLIRIRCKDLFRRQPK